VTRLEPQRGVARDPIGRRQGINLHPCHICDICDNSSAKGCEAVVLRLCLKRITLSRREARREDKRMSADARLAGYGSFPGVPGAVGSGRVLPDVCKPKKISSLLFMTTRQWSARHLC